MSLHIGVLESDKTEVLLRAFNQRAAIFKNAKNFSKKSQTEETTSKRFFSAPWQTLHLGFVRTFTKGRFVTTGKINSTVGQTFVSVSEPRRSLCTRRWLTQLAQPLQASPSGSPGCCESFFSRRSL